MANILKAFVKGKISNTKNSTTFSNYTNIPIIDMLNIIKDYVSNDGQFTKKKAIAQDISRSTGDHFNKAQAILKACVRYFSSHFYFLTK